MLFYFYRRMALSENYMTGEIFFSSSSVGGHNNMGGVIAAGDGSPHICIMGMMCHFFPTSCLRKGFILPSRSNHSG